MFKKGNYSLIPIRFQDQLTIMKWRNEQMYHLRQTVPLTEEDQNNYFQNVIANLFEQERPKQILFSYLENGICIGYGGLVHINWIDKHAEISFVMDTQLEKNSFTKHWQIYLSLIEQLAFDELELHKIFTYAFDLRPQLFTSIEAVGYKKEAVLKEHCLFQGDYKDVLIHSKFFSERLFLTPATKENTELLFTWANDLSVRNNAFSSETIVWKNHVEWYDRKLNSPSTKIFIFYKGLTPIGQIRFDLMNNEWEIDYSIDKEHRGNGLGKKIIQLASAEFSSQDVLKAIVKNDNISSLKVFQQLGFLPTSSDHDSIISFIKKID